MSCPQMGFVVWAAGTVLSNFGSKRCEYWDWAWVTVSGDGLGDH